MRDEKTDVLIVGAGAAGLAAALAAHDAGARVLILEKGEQLGGTAAVSGGVIWTPCNAHMAEQGIHDDSELALSYFRSLSPDLDEPVLQAFVDNAAEAITFLEHVTPLRLKILPGYPDYYLDRPGAMANGGRALDAELYDFKRLGSWRDKVFSSGAVPRLALHETPLGGAASFPSAEEFARRVAEDLRGFGQALVGSLLEGCLTRSITPLLCAKVSSLIVENGKVVGAEVILDGQRRTFRASAVILTTGGFEWDEQLKKTFLRGPLTHPASPPCNTGDGLRMAQKVGASLGNMTSAWWAPTLTPHGEAWGSGEPRSSPVLIERTLPHSIIVNRLGRRFCNEATNYSALAGAFHVFDPATYDWANLPAWLIFDATYKARYSVANVPPGLTNAPEWIVQRSTLLELAHVIGCDGAGLESTVAKYNANVARGSDSEFGRGSNVYDRFYGDRSYPDAAATLGPITDAPFFAVPISIGALGTNGGVRTDRRGRVLDANNEVLSGLFAAGNVMAAPTGTVYAGAGGTLGPALTFGWIAGREAALLRNI